MKFRNPFKKRLPVITFVKDVSDAAHMTKEEAQKLLATMKEQDPDGVYFIEDVPEDEERQTVISF